MWKFGKYLVIGELQYTEFLKPLFLSVLLEMGDKPGFVRPGHTYVPLQMGHWYNCDMSARGNTVSCEIFVREIFVILNFVLSNFVG